MSCNLGVWISKDVDTLSTVFDMIEHTLSSHKNIDRMTLTYEQRFRDSIITRYSTLNYKVDMVKVNKNKYSTAATGIRDGDILQQCGFCLVAISREESEAETNIVLQLKSLAKPCFIFRCKKEDNVSWYLSNEAIRGRVM